MSLRGPVPTLTARRGAPSFWVGNVYWTFKIRIFHRPFWDLENVLSPEGTAKAVPKVVQLFLLMFYFWVGNVYWTFKIRIFHRPFWDLENVLSPEGTSACRLLRGPFVFTYVLFVLENVYLSFKKADGIWGFWKLWNLEMFYPPKGRLLADSRGVHLFLLMFYFMLGFVLGNVYLTFKKVDGICGFWKFWDLEMFYCP